MSSITAPSGREQPPEPVRASPILETQIWNRMHHRDDNWMGAVVGETGIGKSYTCLSIGESVDPEFTIDQVAFSVEEFLRLVMDDSYERGSMIILEEASVEAAAEDFHDISNKVLRTVLETWREQNRGSLLNLPTFSRMDYGARIRMTALIQQQAKFEDKGYAVAKYKHLQTNSDTGEIYRHFPNIGGNKQKFLKIAPPSDGLIEAYEKKKTEYNRERNRQLLEELLEEKADDDDSEKDPQWIAQDILDKGVEQYVDENNNQRYISRDFIELDYDIGSRRSGKVKSALKRELSDARLDNLLAGGG